MPGACAVRVRRGACVASVGGRLTAAACALRLYMFVLSLCWVALNSASGFLQPVCTTKVHTQREMTSGRPVFFCFRVFFVATRDRGLIKIKIAADCADYSRTRAVSATRKPRNRGRGAHVLGCQSIFRRGCDLTLKLLLKMVKLFSDAPALQRPGALRGVYPSGTHTLNRRLWLLRWPSLPCLQLRTIRTRRALNLVLGVGDL